jgi:hypothetical protein
MKNLAIMDVVNIEASPFLTINLYGDKGYIIDQLVTPYEGDTRQAVDLLQQLIKEHGTTLDCYVANKELLLATLNVAGVNGQLKHRDDVQDCEVAVKSVEEVLREFYEIEPLIPLPKLSAWRKWLFVATLKIANNISGGGKYDIV